MDNIITGGSTGPVTLPFSDVEVTSLINVLPTPFGQVTADGMFPDESLTSQFFQIDHLNGVLSALPVTDGGPATAARHDNQDAKIFRVPGIEHTDDVMASEIRGFLALAARAGNQPETLANLFNRRLQRLRTKFNITWELMKMSALKGVVIDGAGNQIVNLFTAFEITQKTVFFNFNDDTSNIRDLCDLVYMLIQQDLSDEVMTGVTAKVSRSFFNALTRHPKVEKFWLQAEQAKELANLGRTKADGGYRPRTFQFGDILFEEYNAMVPMWGGTSTPIIAAGLGHAYPTGTLDTHTTYCAPPLDIRVLDGSTADLGDTIHITTEPMKHGKGIEMLGQSHTLPMWKRPQLLVTLNAGAGASTAAADGE